ncbi:MAG: hypothetical protein K0Q77_649 [Anaerosporomusa subterranea]|nr:hypothetical protein [Anaerosporomusa subterranea]
MKPRQPFEHSQNGAKSCGIAARWERITPSLEGVFFYCERIVIRRYIYA